MKKWEYKKVVDPGLDDTDSLTERDLNDLGAKGWELVAVEPAKVSSGAPGPEGRYVATVPRMFWLKRRRSS